MHSGGTMLIMLLPKCSWLIQPISVAVRTFPLSPYLMIAVPTNNHWPCLQKRK